MLAAVEAGASLESLKERTGARTPGKLAALALWAGWDQERLDADELEYLAHVLVTGHAIGWCAVHCGLGSRSDLIDRRASAFRKLRATGVASAADALVRGEQLALLPEIENGSTSSSAAG